MAGTSSQAAATGTLLGTPGFVSHNITAKRGRDREQRKRRSEKLQEVGRRHFTLEAFAEQLAVAFAGR